MRAVELVELFLLAATFAALARGRSRTKGGLAQIERALLVEGLSPASSQPEPDATLWEGRWSGHAVSVRVRWGTYRSHQVYLECRVSQVFPGLGGCGGRQRAGPEGGGALCTGDDALDAQVRIHGASLPALLRLEPAARGALIALVKQGWWFEQGDAVRELGDTASVRPRIDLWARGIQDFVALLPAEAPTLAARLASEPDGRVRAQLLRLHGLLEGAELRGRVGVAGEHERSGALEVVEAGGLDHPGG